MGLSPPGLSRAIGPLGRKALQAEVAPQADSSGASSCRPASQSSVLRHGRAYWDLSESWETRQVENCHESCYDASDMSIACNMLMEGPRMRDARLTLLLLAGLFTLGLPGMSWATPSGPGALSRGRARSVSPAAAPRGRTASRAQGRLKRAHSLPVGEPLRRQRRRTQGRNDAQSQTTLGVLHRCQLHDIRACLRHHVGVERSPTESTGGPT